MPLVLHIASFCATFIFQTRPNGVYTEFGMDPGILTKQVNTSLKEAKQSKSIIYTNELLFLLTFD